MALKLYNTMTRSTEPFRPIEDNLVRLYTCGPTVYNYAHIGNLRTYVFEDVLKRALKFCGFAVRHVMNVTDVGHLVSDADEGEDKMEKGARREGRSVWDIAQFYWDAFRRDMERLHLIEPDVWCRATEHIDQQRRQVETLMEKGYAYTIGGDGVYFDTSKLSDYGKLARLDVSGLKAGARVEMHAEKRNPTDFALWKFSPADQQRLMEWDNPKGLGGKGFPGWHIECSAMAMEYLGERLDIHCGGVDHVSVHHSNEIAQAEAALGHEWCNLWLHGEFLVLPKAEEAGGDGEDAFQKMAKSGEFLKLDLLVDRGYEPVAYRYFCFTAHYRQQLAFTWEALDSAAAALKNFRRTVLDLRGQFTVGDEPLEAHREAFRTAVEDDLNMPRALAAAWGAARDESAPPGRRYATLVEMDRVLGFGVEEMAEVQLALSDEQIDALIAERTAARAEKNFARADEIRDELADMGVILEDSPSGTTWRRA